METSPASLQGDFFPNSRRSAAGPSLAPTRPPTIATPRSSGAPTKTKRESHGWVFTDLPPLTPPYKGGEFSLSQKYDGCNYAHSDTKGKFHRECPTKSDRHLSQYRYSPFLFQAPRLLRHEG